MAAKTDLHLRLEEVMRDLAWTQADLQKHSGASRSVVGQWLGQVGDGGRPIRKISNVEVAVSLQQASGYSAVWLALGKGEKKVRPSGAIDEASAELLRIYAALDVVGKSRLVAYAADLQPRLEPSATDSPLPRKAANGKR